MKRAWLCLLFVLACDDADGPAPMSPYGGAPDGGTGKAPAEASLTVSGRYALETPIDLTATTFAPAAAADTLARLRQLRDDPAAAFVTALDDAGVPLATQLFAALPDVLASRVRGFINDYVGTRAIAPELSQLLDEAQRSLLRFDLLTELEVPAGVGPPAPPTGVAPPLGRHTLRGVRFFYDGGRLAAVIPRAAVENDGPVVADPPVLVTWVPPATLGIDDHAFGVPLGTYAFLGLDQLADRRYGGTLRVALGKLFDCSAMAMAVARRCVGPVCVGHEPEVRALCEGGLDAVVAKLREEIEAHNYDAVRFQRGSARSVDDSPRDGRVDVLVEGRWTCTLDAGQGPRPADTTFSGRPL